MTCEVNPIVVTIKSGETKSNPFYIGNILTAGLIWPAAMTGTTFTTEVSHHPTGFFVPLDETNSAFATTLTFAAGKAIEIWAGSLHQFPFPFAKLVSSAAEAADRTLIIVGKG